MTSRLVSPTKALGFSNLYLDFLAGQSSARQLFVSTGFEPTASQINRRSYHREALVSILSRQNQQFRSGPQTFEAIRSLADSRAVCYFAGQQAGLFGGPLFSLLKALAITKSARELSLTLQRPVVPVFWIASDDHDFAEVNHTFVLSRDCELCRIEYAAVLNEPVPVARIRLDNADALAQAIRRLKDCLGESEFTPELYGMLEQAYAPGASFVDAFGKVMAYLTRDLGLVLFSPADDEVKRLSAPFFHALIENRSQLRQTLNAANQKLEQARYHLQVEKSLLSVHLFHHAHGRLPVVERDGQFHAGKSTFSLEQLRREIDQSPEIFSPDVLTRPLLQSYLFPAVAQMGGPSEIAYFAQINPLFEQFDLPVPVHTARPTATIIEKRFEKTLSDYKISFEDLTTDIEQVINRVLARSFPQDIEIDFQNLRAEVFSRFDQFSDRSLKFDPSLADFARQTAGKLDFALKAFEGKVFSSHKKRSREVRDRIYRLQHALYPDRAMQDRVLNPSYFIARYGPNVVSYLHDHLDHDQAAHQLITLGEYMTA